MCPLLFFISFCPILNIIINLQVIDIGSDDDSQSSNNSSLSQFGDSLLAAGGSTGNSLMVDTVSYMTIRLQ